MKRLLFFLSTIVLFSLASKAYCFDDHSEIDYSMNAGNMYYCASTGTVTTQAGISISSPTISLYNPPGSGKRLVLLDVGAVFMASPAAATSFVLAYNIVPSSAVTPQVSGNITSAIVGKSTSTASTVSIASCTVQGILPATPVGFRYLSGTTGASAIGGAVFNDNVNGKVVIYPGGLVSLHTTAAATVQANLLWREEPL